MWVDRYVRVVDRYLEVEPKKNPRREHVPMEYRRNEDWPWGDYI